MPIVRNSFIQISKLINVTGRIGYISSSVRQENLYAVYETVEEEFWTELAKCNQEEFKKSGTVGKCIEARELIIALPESFVEYEPSKLLKLFTEHFKQNYGTECVAALHHNKRKTNYHIHLIFSERKLLDEPIEKIATRNMFYDENRKHVRTKKEILDEEGEVRKGCKIIQKGEVYERKIFSIKDSKFKSEKFLDDVKQSYTNLINIYIKDDAEKLTVFDKNGVYLPMKKIGKNNP
ncbi:MAG: MobA/MobL family protein, partial [Lachnospiraceae bacterium]|nr:MobA/MobL family protein [Lachnospiraceae bacterium]